jgi:tight adherence protein B
MEIVLIGVSIFLGTIVIIELLLYAFKHMKSTQRIRIRKRLQKFAYEEGGPDGSQILKRRIYSDVPLVNRLLKSTPGIAALDRLIAQANVSYSIGFYIFLSIFLCACGFMIANWFLSNLLPATIIALAVGATPYLYLLNLKIKRLAKFKTQLPDSLELIARSLKAGNAFTSGLKMAADEFDDPLGTEFSETLDEINYGVNATEALYNLSRRIDCEELKYFVVGVILQRETGGNLAEMIEALAHLIREKFKFQGRVRALAAEGKLSAIILVCLPFCITGYMIIVEPKFINPLITEPIGKIMIAVAALLMVVGIFVMKKMVDIKV